MGFNVHSLGGLHRVFSDPGIYGSNSSSICDEVSQKETTSEKIAKHVTFANDDANAKNPGLTDEITFVKGIVTYEGENIYDYSGGDCPIELLGPEKIKVADPKRQPKKGILKINPRDIKIGILKDEKVEPIEAFPDANQLTSYIVNEMKEILKKTAPENRKAAIRDYVNEQLDEGSIDLFSKDDLELIKNGVIRENGGGISPALLFEMFSEVMSEREAERVEILVDSVADLF